MAAMHQLPAAGHRAPPFNSSSSAASISHQVLFLFLPIPPSDDKFDNLMSLTHYGICFDFFFSFSGHSVAASPLQQQKASFACYSRGCSHLPTRSAAEPIACLLCFIHFKSLTLVRGLLGDFVEQIPRRNRE